MLSSANRDVARLRLREVVVVSGCGMKKKHKRKAHIVV